MSIKSIGVQCSAVHSTISVESLVWLGSFVNSADTEDQPDQAVPAPGSVGRSCIAASMSHDHQIAV
jgi:hypothetical protein